MDGFYDLHTHTAFSDGSPMAEMVSAAESAGCDGIGLSDHCILVEDDFGRRATYDLVDTYERRRERIETVREGTDLRVFDGVELSFVPGTESEIRSFLDRASFEYSIGAVHFADEYDFTSSSSYADADMEAKAAAVGEYYETLVDMIRSELFDIVAHIDLPERQPRLRGLTTDDHYDAVADALTDSRTVPELNAGRVFRSQERLHPNPDVLDRFVTHDIEFTLGTDSHAPEEVERRTPYLREFITAESDLLIRLPDVLGGERV